jgi:hypothetical protein
VLKATKNPPRPRNKPSHAPDAVNRDYRGKIATRKEYFMSEFVLALNLSAIAKKSSKFLRKIENRKRDGRPVTKHGAIDTSAFTRAPRQISRPSGCSQ